MRRDKHWERHTLWVRQGQRRRLGGYKQSGSGEINVAAQAGISSPLQQVQHLAALGLSGAATDQDHKSRMLRVLGSQG